MNLVSADIHASGLSVGLTLSDDTIIGAGIQVTADPQEAVYISSNYDLFNYGSIVSTGKAGILSIAGSTDIFNGVGATISGDPAILTQLGFTHVTNYGSIIGTDDFAVEAMGSAGFLKVVNHGTIFAPKTAIGHYSNQFSGAVYNTGAIEGGQYGVVFNTADGIMSHVDNSGSISGFYSIRVDAGALTLDNSGVLNGELVLLASGNQNDIITNSGKILGTVYLGSGDDSFTGTGGSSGSILGGAGKDRIIAGAGVDTMDGGLGKDVLTGGAGPDHFVFSDTLSALTNVDRITDFSVPQDTIDLDNAIFAALGMTGILKVGMFHAGAHAHDANDHIIYNATTGALFYDANGNAAGGEVKFATLAHHPALSAADFLVI